MALGASRCHGYCSPMGLAVDVHITTNIMAAYPYEIAARVWCVRFFAIYLNCEWLMSWFFFPKIAIVPFTSKSPDTAIVSHTSNLPSIAIVSYT